ncbi:hypothetical protein TVAG_110570 [Trichomonas vaginalis G3]|uniref:Uncharacterized protein n=1 Tax=Trichomonas vaginalis (strain ATCC PRA-98 / G3) TaxID=412133 RepID=A2DGQ8_TRIV3|nr:hypothetical protein TVAGG3_0997460 [Trichomonas vaginalis G3]EAY20445.1 hypothetical protein TVAG_110570 [Trichomonas vaginalis G3]KAI5490505.1 hypothetical protein TVAGG3_0997460 [Trichomonas vaginalis G3]|eukprot:XP_001581431.1 hypothetical protein [Trichomonas vaginalis G3]
MSAPSSTIAKKKRELEALELEIKRAKGVAFKLMNAPQEYQAPNGQTVGDLEKELQSIRKVLHIPEDDSETDLIELLNDKISRRTEAYEGLKNEIAEMKEKIGKKQSVADDLQQQIDEQLRIQEKARKKNRMNSDINLPEIPFGKNDVTEPIVDNLSKYKIELGKLKADFDKIKLDITAYFDNYKKQFNNQIKDEMEKRRKQILEKRQICLELQKHAQELEEQHNKLQQELQNYQINPTDENDGTDMPTQSPEEAQKEFDDHIRSFVDVFDKFKDTHTDHCEDLLKEFNLKVDNLEPKTIELHDKLSKLGEKVQQSKAVDQTVVRDQANNLMRDFLKTLWMKERLKLILNEMEPKLKEQADKFEEQIAKEKEMTGKVIYENLTINEIRKLIILFIKENAQINLANEAMQNDYKEKTRELGLLSSPK